jgi:hypothetical protein
MGLKKLVVLIAFAFISVSCSSAKMELPYCWGKKGISKAYCKVKKSVGNLQEKIADRKDELID